MSDVLQTGRKPPARCPKCNAENALGLAECAACGIIFARYRDPKSRPSKTDMPKPKPKAKRRYAPLDLMAMGAYAHFFRRLGRLIDAGMSLPQAVPGAAASGQPARLAAKILPHLEAGHDLVRALDMERAVLPSYVWGHLAAGIHAGRLTENLERLATDIEARRKRILDQIFNWRMLWFFVMLFFAAGSLAITGSVGEVDDDAINKGTSGVLMAIGLSSAPKFIFYLLGFLLVCVAFGWFQIKGKYHLSARFTGYEAFRLQLPITGAILIQETLIRYLNLLSDLLRAGLPLYLALDLAKEDIELPSWRNNFDAIREAVERGEALGAAFTRVPHLPADLIAEITIGEKTGELAQGLNHFTTRLEDDLKNKRTTLNVITAAALFGLGVLLTLIVTIRGLAAITSVYDKI